METTHKPVLLDEVLSHIPFTRGMTVIDATLGGGWYSRAISRAIQPRGRVVSFDMDIEAIKRFHSTADLHSITLVHSNFAFLRQKLSEIGIGSADVIVADLGISSDQLNDASRGLSFLHDGPLDMRLDRNETLTAAVVVNSSSEDEIFRMFRDADETHARSMARGIVRARNNHPIITTRNLIDVLRATVPERYKMGKRHFCTKAFMAIRMKVNNEVQNLSSFLEQSLEILRPGGYMGVVSFHSGEDAIVKDFFRKNARGCICPKEFPICCCGKKPKMRLLFRKPIKVSESEVLANSRSRSARFRLAQKKENTDEVMADFFIRRTLKRKSGSLE